MRTPSVVLHYLHLDSERKQNLESDLQSHSLTAVHHHRSEIDRLMSRIYYKLYSHIGPQVRLDYLVLGFPFEEVLVIEVARVLKDFNCNFSQNLKGYLPSTQ